MENEPVYLDERQWDTSDKEAKDIMMLNLAFKQQDYLKDETIFVQKTESTIIYVLNGNLKVFIYNPQGIEQLLYYVEEGNSCFANYADNEQITLHIVAAVNVKVCFIETKSLIDAFAEQAPLLVLLLESVQRRISAMADRLLDLASCSNRGKICKLIHGLAINSTIFDDEKIIIKVFPSRTDIALFIGTHKRNVIRCLSELENEGVIQKTGKGLIVNDMIALQAIIDQEYRGG